MYKSFWQSGTVNARKLIGLPEVSMEDWAITVFQDVEAIERWQRDSVA